MSTRWTPTDRLALVDLIARRPGADSEAFFAAHGLAQAYARPGNGASKKAKINSALYEAGEIDIADNVLDAAAAAFRKDDEPASGGSVASSGKIFISHASKDQRLADLVNETLILGGVPVERVFYSSARSTGIPAGLNVGQHLQETLRDCSVMIELITQRFLSRTYCLMELGGAWAMNKPTFPIVVPPLSRSETVDAIGNVQLNTLASGDEVGALFNELYDRLVTQAGLPLTLARWSEATTRFKAALPEVIAELSSDYAIERAEPVKSAPVESEPPQLTAPSSEPVESGGLRASNFSLVNGQFSIEVHGEVTNSASRPKMAIVTATFYGENGSIVGSAQNVINSIESGEMRSFSIPSMQPMTDYSRFTVQFDSVFDAS